MTEITNHSYYISRPISYPGLLSLEVREMCSEEDKEKLDELFEKYKPYISKPGEGASLFDDWNELAPDFLDQCTVPDRKVNGKKK